MGGIDGIGGGNNVQYGQQQTAQKQEQGGSGFGDVMKGVADGALAGVSAVAPLLPGGELVKAAADGLRGFTRESPAGVGGAQGEQLDKMWAMQRENQMFNLQYLQLQTQLQSDNRAFSTISNLMKARHDTAKAAINNMHV